MTSVPAAEYLRVSTERQEFSTRLSKNKDCMEGVITQNPRSRSMSDHY
jgi:hypothetical protein